MTKYTECPNLECQAQWGIEEISFQECDCCGWPNVEEEDYDFDYDDYVLGVDLDEENE